MRVAYKHIHFIRVGQTAKRPIWTCRNNRTGGELGRVRWYGPWRRYCYFPIAQAVYSQGCLTDIAAFLEDLAKGGGQMMLNIRGEATCVT